MTDKKLAVYHESVQRDNKMVDRYWVAPTGLGISEAKRRRIGVLYKTRRGAEQKARRAEPFVALLDASDEL